MSKTTKRFVTGWASALLAIIILTIVMVYPAFAATPKIYGVNYGHNFAGKTYNATTAGADLDELKRAGVQAVRLYMGTAGNSDVAFTKPLAVLAKSKGFVVTWGVCTGGSVDTTAQWDAYLAGLDSYAAWANDNGVDYFSLGNEEEFQLPALTVQTGIRNAAARIKLAYPNLKLTYATAAEPAWITNWQDSGALDTVGFNLYVAFTDLTNQIKKNPKATITEWNTDGGITAQGIRGNQSKWASTLVKDRDIINKSGIKAYLFTIRGNGGGIDDSWSMWVGNTRRQAWKDLIR